MLREGAAERDTEWFAKVEDSNDIVVYQVRCDASEWTRMCLRQADRVLVVLSAGPPPNPEAAKAIDGMSRTKRPGSVELVILHARSSRRLAFTRMLLGPLPSGIPLPRARGQRVGPRADGADNRGAGGRIVLSAEERAVSRIWA